MTHSITHLIAEWSPFDAAAHLREVARHQVRTSQRVAVVVLSANPEAREEIEKLGATCVFIRRRWQLDPFAMRECTVQLRSMQPRVVQFWGTGAAEFAPIARWALPQAQLIATLPAEVPRAESWFAPWLGSCEAVLDGIVVDYAANPAEKTTVITPGVAVPSDAKFCREEVLAELDLPADAELITLAGALDRSQRIDEAIWNFELVRTLREQACLVILGEGPDRARLQRYARLVSNPTSIRFIKDVRDLFGEKGPDTVFRVSSLYWQPGQSESIPTGLLVAQSLGVPAIANDGTAHSEVITHGENGYLVPISKRSVWTRHTIELLENSDTRARFAAAARAVWAERFVLDRMLLGYDKISNSHSQASLAG